MTTQLPGSVSRKPDFTHMNSDILLQRAAKIVAADAAAALPRLLALAGEALGANTLALYRLTSEDTLRLLAGAEVLPLRVQANAVLAAWTNGEKFPEDTAEEAAALIGSSTERPFGLWAACLDTTSRARWPEVSETLAPFFVVALRQTLWQEETTAAQVQVERRIREVATVYEIGQAMDKVEIDRLLDMVTEKAAAVMEAQACSLLLRLPETDSLVIAASFGLPSDIVENARIFVGSSVAGHVVETGERGVRRSVSWLPAGWSAGARR